MLTRFLLLASVVAVAAASPSFYDDDGRQHHMGHYGRHEYHGHHGHGWYSGHDDQKYRGHEGHGAGHGHHGYSEGEHQRDGGGDSYGYYHGYGDRDHDGDSHGQRTYDGDRDRDGGGDSHGYSGVRHGDRGHGYGDDDWESHRGYHGHGDTSEKHRDGDDHQHGKHWSDDDKPKRDESDHKPSNKGWEPRDGGWGDDHKPDDKWGGDKKPPSGDDNWGGDKNPRGRDDKWDGDKDPHGRDDKWGRDSDDDRDIDGDNWHRPQGDEDGDHPDSDNHHDKTPAPQSETLRQQTEEFVSGVIRWMNDLVTSEVAASFVVDTTFSLKKSDDPKTDEVCNSNVLGQFVPVIRKAVDQPQNVDLLGEEVQSITWKPTGECGKVETEGGSFATVQITCSAQTLLNVSIATSGSTPTIKSQPVENAGLYLDVSILSGDITATDAQGSIVGVIKTRHFPANVDQVLTNWTTAVQDCARRYELEVRGSVGGGWTVYTPDDKAEDGYATSSVGYTESFSLSFPGAAPSTLNVAMDAVGHEASPTDITIHALETTPATLREIASAASSAYISDSLACRQSSSAVAGCGSRVIMTELQAVQEASSTLTFNMLPQRLAPASDSSLPATLLIAGLGIFGAVATMALLTLRRRKGYAPLAQV